MCSMLLAALWLMQSLDSLNCHAVGRWPYGGGVMFGEAISESLLYVHSGCGVYILDVTRPDDIRKVGEFATPRIPGFISRKDTLLCIGESDAGVALYDISELRNPRLLGRYITPDMVLGVSFDGRYALAACSDCSLRVVDFAQPSSPQLAGSCQLAAGGVEIAVTGHVVCVTTEFGGLSLVDVSNPAAPVTVGNFSLSRDAARAVRVADTVAYVTFTQAGLVALSISDPSNPYELGRYSGGGGAGDLAIRDTLALVETYNWPRSIRALSVANPRAPRLIGSFRMTSGISGFMGLAVDRQRCYTQWEDGALDSLLVIDISNPSAMTVLGSYAGIPAVTDDVVVVDTLILTGTRGDGLRIFGFSDPSNPTPLGRVCDTTRAGRVFVRDTLAYLACWHGNVFRVVNFADPRNPVQIGMLDSFGFGQDVAVQMDKAYVVGDEQLRVIDVGDPTQPRQVGKLNVPSSAFGVDVDGSTCVVAAWYAGIRIIDVTDASNPREVASFPTPCSAAVDVTIQYPYVYYADVGGIGVLDITDPASPQEVAFVWTVPGKENWGLSVSGNLPAAAQAWGGVRILDVSNPAFPVELGYYDTPGWGFHALQDGRMTYLADGEGFVVTEYVSPGIAEQPRTSPRGAPGLRYTCEPPFHVLRLHVPAGAPAAVSIIDTSGRALLSRTCEQPSNLGEAEIDVSSLPSGTYILKVVSGRRLTTGRLIIVR